MAHRWHTDYLWECVGSDVIVDRLCGILTSILNSRSPKAERDPSNFHHPSCQHFEVHRGTAKARDSVARSGTSSAEWPIEKRCDLTVRKQRVEMKWTRPYLRWWEYIGRLVAACEGTTTSHMINTRKWHHFLLRRDVNFATMLNFPRCVSHGHWKIAWSRYWGEFCRQYITVRSVRPAVKEPMKKMQYRRWECQDQVNTRKIVIRSNNCDSEHMLYSATISFSRCFRYVYTCNRIRWHSCCSHLKLKLSRNWAVLLFTWSFRRFHMKCSQATQIPSN